MTLNRKIHWEKLAEIYELAEHFEADFEAFKQKIEQQIDWFESKFSGKSLDKFAKLRVLEVTNGVTQWAFRRGDAECLSVEQTRECMNLVMGFMKNVELCFPSEGVIPFNDAEKELVNAGRSLYKDAFKNNVPSKQEEYYAASTAQFIVYGHPRLQVAMDLVKQDYETLFSPYYIERGRKYIAPYLESFAEIH